MIGRSSMPKDMAAPARETANLIEFVVIHFEESPKDGFTEMSTPLDKKTPLQSPITRSGDTGLKFLSGSQASASVKESNMDTNELSQALITS